MLTTFFFPQSIELALKDVNFSQNSVSMQFLSSDLFLKLPSSYVVLSFFFLCFFFVFVKQSKKTRKKTNCNVFVVLQPF